MLLYHKHFVMLFWRSEIKKSLILCHRHIFTSSDCGATVSRHNLENVVPTMIDFDERRDRVFLIHDLVLELFKI